MMLTFRLTQKNPYHIFPVDIGECIIVKAQSLERATNLVYRVLETTRKGYFDCDLFNYGVDDPAAQRTVLLNRKHVDVEITIVKPFETALQLEDMAKKYEHLSKKTEEAFELLDSPYMPGCVDGLKQCIEKMKEDDIYKNASTSDIYQ